MKLNPVSGHSSAGRRAFTLVELLAVIGIIALLIALLSTAAVKFRDAQIANSTDARLMRIQQKLNADYGEVLQKCQRDRPPDNLVTYCGDLELARAVHTAATLKANFPESFQEATNPTVFGPFNYPAKKTFAAVAAASAAAVTEEKQRAVLLYLIVTERATGSTGGGDESGSPGDLRTENLGGRDFTYYVDLYGQPITYFRYGWVNTTTPNADLNAAPYTRTPSRLDPFDPQGKVAGWRASPNAPSPPLTQAASQSDIDTIRTQLQFGGTTFASGNRVPTVVSYGKNKRFDGFQGDDQVGYRLNRLGGKGEKGE